MAFLVSSYSIQYSVMKSQRERPVCVTPRKTHLEKDRHINMIVVNKSTYILCVCVFLFHSVCLSALNQWSVRTSFKLLHSINTDSIDFFKQLMEAFKAGKLIKIICRSSSFKDSPLVYVELNCAWLENLSIGHCNWLVFLMAFQCSCISQKETKFLWQIACFNSNTPRKRIIKDSCRVSFVLKVSCQCLEAVLYFMVPPGNKQ